MAEAATIVAYVIGSMGDARAGTERSLLSLIENLDRRRFTPILISLQDCPFAHNPPDTCEFHCLKVEKLFTPAFWRGRNRLVALFRERKVNVVQTFFIEAHLLAGLAARKAGVPLIVSSRRNLGYSYDLKEQMLLRLANRYPHIFLANSVAVADAIGKIEGLDRTRLRVIYNGIATKPSEARKQDDRPTIVMVANLRPVKEIDTLIRALPSVAARYPDLLVRIVGEGPERSRLDALVDQLRLKANVEFVGGTSDVGSAIAGAQVGVLTSRSEGFSNAILEYMREGLPVVATNVGGNREAVEDGKNGYLFAVGDSLALANHLIRLLEDPSLARKLGDSGRETLHSKFSIESMVQQHQDLYTSFLERRRSER